MGFSSLSGGNGRLALKWWRSFFIQIFAGNSKSDPTRVSFCTAFMKIRNLSYSGENTGFPGYPPNFGGWTSTPYFPAFTDAPKFQVFRNMKRTLMAGAMFSGGGVPVIPHLTAIDSSQWSFWRKFLTAHPEIGVVCKEFQTGFKEFGKGIEVLDELSRIQEHVNRPIHPILVGGGRFYGEAKRRFDSRHCCGAIPVSRTRHRCRFRLVVNPQSSAMVPIFSSVSLNIRLA